MESTLYTDRGYWNDVQKYIFDCCEKYADNDLCVYLENEKQYRFTYGEMLVSIRRIGSYVSRILRPGRHVALLGKTTVEWLSSYLAMLCYGLVVSPLDVALPKEEIARQFAFADADVLLFASPYAAVAECISEQSPDTICIPLDETLPGYETSIREIASRSIRETEPPKLSDKKLCEIVYTSGTTGLGKGVMLSNENIISTVMFGIRLVDLSSSDKVLSIMPNNHTYELTVGILTPLYFGMSIILNNTLKTLLRNMQIFHPTTMLVVPALLNMFRKTLMREIVRGKTFQELKAYFGRDLKTLICGGAFLSDDLMSFYKGLGLSLIQGYGITECSPIVSCNTDRVSRQLGEINPYCKVRCIDGEICVSGKNVMLGYYKNRTETNKVIIDGWFHTGDLGYVDDHNCLCLIGRKDNLIINSNGENISPEIIENQLSEYDIISDCMVYSERDMIAVSIYPNYRYAYENNITSIPQTIFDAVHELNRKLPPKMRIERTHIRKTPFEMTTTMKIKRHEMKDDEGEER